LLELFRGDPAAPKHPWRMEETEPLGWRWAKPDSFTVAGDS